MMNITDIFNNYYSYIYNYAFKLTCHPADASDIAQETFIKAWRKLDTLKDENALAKWLRSICYKEFLMKMRSDQNSKYSLVDDWDKLERDGALLTNVTILPEDEVIVFEDIKSLQNGCFFAMVRRLSLNQRITFSLVDMYGLDITYVAGVMGITKGAAKGLLYRARMNIDSFFAGHCNLINEGNPCSCKAWIDFSTNRAAMQKKATELVDRLDFEEKGYEYNEGVRKKLFYLYSNIPEQKPPEGWYEQVLTIISGKG